MERSEYIQIIHKDKVVTTLVGSLLYEKSIAASKDILSTKIKIPIHFEHRPDLLAYSIYNDIDYWDKFLEINNIFDPFEGLRSGDEVVV